MNTPHLAQKMVEIDTAWSEIKEMLNKTEDAHNLETCYYVGFLFGIVQRLVGALHTIVDEAKEEKSNKMENKGGVVELGYS
jgi:hypothetical protein